jgi:hypothetical protein
MWVLTDHAVAIISSSRCLISFLKVGMALRVLPHLMTAGAHELTLFVFIQVSTAEQALFEIRRFRDMATCETAAQERRKEPSVIEAR